MEINETKASCYLVLVVFCLNYLWQYSIQLVLES